jgi:hypothetical protein
MFSTRGTARGRLGRVIALAATAALTTFLGGTLVAGPAAADTGAPPVLTSGAPPDIVYGQAYSFQFSASGNPIGFNESGALPSGISWRNTTGVLSGTSTSLGVFPITIQPVDVDGPGQAESYTLRVTGTAPSISGTPPDGAVNASYSFTPGIGDSNPLPHFTLTAGSLPAGLQLFTDGTIGGTPTTQGPGAPFTVTASNGVEPAASQTYTIAVGGERPRIVSAPPATATVGVEFYGVFHMAATPTPTSSLLSGTLPPGLSLDAYGQVMGIPTTAGSYTFTVAASNGNLPDATATATIVVSGPPAVAASISGTPPTTVPVSSSLQFQYTLGGSPAPATTVTAGNLPPGLTLDAHGYLSGSVTTAGSYTFTVTADNGVQSASTTSTIRVDAPVARPTITGTPPAGVVGEPYSASFRTTGSPQPTVTRWAGSLPPGLTLSATGTLSGTPTRAGTWQFIVRAANGSGTPASRAVSLQIRPTPALAIYDAAVREGDSGTRSLLFRVVLDHPSTAPVTVQWSTVDGTARAGTDYTAGAGTLVLAPGETVGTVTVQVRGDRTREGTENLSVRLRTPAHATLGRASGIGTIVNDD